MKSRHNRKPYKSHSATDIEPIVWLDILRFIAQPFRQQPNNFVHFIPLLFSLDRALMADGEGGQA
ncbi:hypothetical protein [Agrobacterium rosae]|uniref:hypothetical protein n=1 Tax=Agrobacterium rosae TaxID=1972867 RepID=UPI00097DAE26|nr:hypothetical protein [Agrobacterium rosae]